MSGTHGKPTLREQEAAARAEARAARRWYARNKHRLDPQELPRERTRNPDGRTTVRTYINEDLLSNRHTGEDQDVVYSERNRFVPIQGQDSEVDIEAAAKAARVERAMASLPKGQRELLNKHLLQGQSLGNLARRGETRQSVHERVEWAKAALLEKLLAQEHQAVELTQEDF